MIDTENGHITSQVLSSRVSQDFDLRISRDEETDQEIEERLVSDIINASHDYDKSSFYHGNMEREVTFLPRLVIDKQLLIPKKTYERLKEFKQTIEQDEQGEEARRNYVPSSVLTEAELYLRLETIWWLDKSTGAVSVDAERVKMKESNDQLGGVESLDFEFEDIPDGVYVRDSEGTDDINNEEDAPKKKSKEKGKCVRVRKCELYKTIKGRKHNSKQVWLCWYYE